MKFILFSLMALCLIVSCKKEEAHQPVAPPTCQVKCTNIPMQLAFSNSYSLEDLETVEVKLYTYGSSYSQLEEDRTYTLADTTRYTENSQIGLGFSYLRLTADYDYEIIIPATGQTFRIWGIIEPNVTGTFGCNHNYTCAEAIREFSISGGEYQRLQFYDYPMYLQLKK